MVFKNIMVRNVKPYCLNSLLSNLKYYNRSSEYYNKVAFKIEPGNRVLVLLSSLKYYNLVYMSEPFENN